MPKNMQMLKQFQVVQQRTNNQKLGICQRTTMTYNITLLRLRSRLKPAPQASQEAQLMMRSPRNAYLSDVV